MSSDKFSILDRVKKLVALAGSGNEHEARNAAVEACRLIRMHSLVVTTTPSPLPVTFPAVRRPNSTEDVAEWMRRHAKRSPSGRSASLDDLEKQPGARRIVDDPGFAKRRREAKEPPYTCDAREGGTCLDCGRSYGRGERIWLRDGVGGVHAFTCDTEVLYG